MWKSPFTATGRVPGIKGNVDRNAFFGSEKQFRDWLDGRYDIGSRKSLKQDEKPTSPRLAVVPQPMLPLPPLPQQPVRAELPMRNLRLLEPLRLLPPKNVPDTTGSIKR